MQRSAGVSPDTQCLGIGGLRSGDLRVSSRHSASHSGECRTVRTRPGKLPPRSFPAAQRADTRYCPATLKLDPDVRPLAKGTFRNQPATPPTTDAAPMGATPRLREAGRTRRPSRQRGLGQPEYYLETAWRPVPGEFTGQRESAAVPARF